jgi:hypothetical protein
MNATPADRALAEQFAGRVPFETTTADEWKAINWTCHAPTTVVSGRNADGHMVVVAECVDYDPEVAIATARKIAGLPNVVRALQGLMALYDSDEGCRSTPEYIAAGAALAAMGVTA